MGLAEFIRPSFRKIGEIFGSTPKRGVVADSFEREAKARKPSFERYPDTYMIPNKIIGYGADVSEKSAAVKADIIKKKIIELGGEGQVPIKKEYLDTQGKKQVVEIVVSQSSSPSVSYRVIFRWPANHYVFESLEFFQDNQEEWRIKNTNENDKKIGEIYSLPDYPDLNRIFNTLF